MADVQGAVGGVGRLAERLVRMAPPMLLRAGLPPRRVRSVLVEVLPPSDAARAALAMAGRGGAPVDVRLAAGLFLRRSVALPAVARRDEAGAVALQMRQSMPGQAEGLIWRHVETGGGAVEVYVLKQARLDELLRDAGVTLRQVTIDGVEAAPLYDARAEVDRAERFWNRLVPLAVAGLVAAVLAGQGWALAQAMRGVAEAGAAVAALRDEAAAARAEAETRGAASAARMADVARLARDGQRLALLADLTRVLGDGVWISSFALDGDVLRLAGFAQGEVAQVVAAIRPLGWVAAVDLDGSVAVEAGGGERRFQLLVTLAAEGAE